MPRRMEDDDDYEICCRNCGKCFTVWMGMSVVQCPYCGKVYL